MVDFLDGFDEGKVPQTMTTTSKAAEVFGLTPRTIRYWIQAGLLPATLKGHYYLFDFEDAESIARKQGHKFPPDFWVRKAKALGAGPSEVSEIADYDLLVDSWGGAGAEVETLIAVDQEIPDVTDVAPKFEAPVTVADPEIITWDGLSDRDAAIEEILGDAVASILDLCAIHDDWSDLPGSVIGIPGLVDAYDAHLKAARAAREQDEILVQTQANNRPSERRNQGTGIKSG